VSRIFYLLGVLDMFLLLVFTSDSLVLPQLATETADAWYLFLDGFSYLLAIPGVCVCRGARCST
jgi:hypothetical protein